MSEFGDVYRDRRVLITGHTGFKGSWLALWLRELGAEVTGLALAPPTPLNHWDLLGLPIAQHRLDIRDVTAVTSVMQQSKPEMVFHLAAQSLVRRSFDDPLETWSTNVNGTVSVLEASRRSPSVRAIVVASSDKCYENLETHRAFNEGDRLGGADPYSASKAATELVVASFRDAIYRLHGGPLVATGRAGNVIGGGDWSEDRLVPDLVRAVTSGQKLAVRAPESTRPWQHVLESLSGYLVLGKHLLAGDRRFESGWNFGPRPTDVCTVASVLVQMRHYWPDLSWQIAPNEHKPEAILLRLDSSKAETELGWTPVWSLSTALRATAEWYAKFLGSSSIESVRQLRDYAADARAARALWAVT